VRFEGEANSVQRFGNQSSTILGPAGDYAFKSTDAANTAAGLQHVFEHLAIQSSGGGIYMSDGGVIVRDCLLFGSGLSFISIRPGKPTLDNVYSSVPAGPTRTALAVKSSGRNARLIP